MILICKGPKIKILNILIYFEGFQLRNIIRLKKYFIYETNKNFKRSI